MQIKDLRRPARRGLRDAQLPTTLSPALVPEAERLFSKPGVVDALLALFQEELLQGRKIVKEPAPPSPLFITQREVTPLRRGQLLGALERGAPLPAPDPRLSFRVTVLWPRLRVRRVTSSLVEVVSGGEGIANLDTTYAYYLRVAGQDHAIDEVEVEGSRVRLYLHDPITSEVGPEATAAVHNGARTHFTSFYTLGPHSDLTAGQAFVRGREGPPSHDLSMVVARPMHGTLHITSRNAVGETTHVSAEHVTVGRAPNGQVVGARYDELRVQDNPTGSALAKAETRLVLRLRLRKTDGAAITRLRCQEFVYSRGKWKAMGERDVPVTHEAVRWQLESPTAEEATARGAALMRESPTLSTHPTDTPIFTLSTNPTSSGGPILTTAPDSSRTFDIALGRASAALSRRIEVTCLDELGREQGSGEVTVNPIEESFALSPDLHEAFGRLARITAAPLEVDIEHYARVLNKQADALVAAAETRIESGIQGQAPRQNTKPQTS